MKELFQCVGCGFEHDISKKIIRPGKRPICTKCEKLAQERADAEIVTDELTKPKRIDEGVEVKRRLDEIIYNDEVAKINKKFELEYL